MFIEMFITNNNVYLLLEKVFIQPQTILLYYPVGLL